MISTNAPGNLSGKRLVVFGAGYVGGELARQAAAAGVRVTALTRNEEKARAFSAEGIEAVVADLASDAWHGEIAGGADFVVNCVSGGGAGIEGYRRSYLEGMRSVAGWLMATGGAGATVYTSSTSVYPQDGGVRVDEMAAVDRNGEKPRVLVEAEELLVGLPRDAGRRTVLRLAGIYGPGRHHLLEQVRSGEVAGRGDHHLNLIHREDICGAIWSALLADGGAAGTGVANGEVFNVADDGAARKAEIVEWLAGKLGVAVPRFSGAPAAGRRAVTPDRIIDNTKIKRVLGWRARYPSFREGYAAILGA
jgi:nucleoside-diphosphate-sugar epimerase